MGRNILKIVATDPNPAADLLDVQHDIKTIAALDPAVNWGWYQQGFNANDSSTVTSYNTSLAGANAGYVLHHNGPQYFAYLAGNPQVLNTNLHGAKDFLTPLITRRCRAVAACSICAAATTTTMGWYRSILRPPSRSHLSATTIIRPTRINRSPRPLPPSAINAIATSPYWSRKRDHHHLRRDRRVLRPRFTGSAQHVSRRLAAFGRSAYSNHPDLALCSVRQDLASLQRARLGDQIHQRAVRPRAARLVAR